MSHTETNEDWEKRYENTFLMSLGEKVLEKGSEYVEKNTRIVYLQCAIKAYGSLRQSDKELILGKMDNTLKDFYFKDGIASFSTCKSIVEEVMK